MENQKTKILHIAQAAGGVDRYLRSLFRYLDRDRFETYFICSQDFDPEVYRELADYVTVVNMKREIGKDDLTAAKQVRKYIKEYAPDIVYAHSSKAGAILRMANIGNKCKCIYNPHGWAFNMDVSPKKKWVYTNMERVMAPFCDAIVCISEAEKNSAVNNKICSEDKLYLINNGIDIDEYENGKKTPVSRAQVGIPNDAFVVGMSGRLSRQKSPDVFVKMARRVLKEIPNAFFLMIGSGELQEKVEAYAEKYDFASRIVITGWVDNPLSYIELLDVAVLLSRWEGFGLAVPEYMLCHTPVVASNVDALPFLITSGKNGLLVEAGDYESACKAVLELYKNEKLKKDLCEQAYKDVHEFFDVKRVAKEHEVLFSTLLGGKLEYEEDR